MKRYNNKEKKQNHSSFQLYLICDTKTRNLSKYTIPRITILMDWEYSCEIQSQCEHNKKKHYRKASANAM